MSNSDEQILLKLKPLRYFDLLIISLLTILFAGLLFFLGYILPTMANYFCYSIAALIVLGLIFYDVVKIKIIRNGSIETITFTTNGIHFENSLIGLRELVNWSSVVDIVVIKVDEDDDQEDEQKEPNKVVVLTPNNEECFFLSDYETIFTNRKTIWERIQEVQTIFQPNT
jgi:hypothetical protein